MYSSSGRPSLSALGIGIAAYVIGTAFAATVTTHAVWRAGIVLLHQLAPAADTPRTRTPHAHDVAAKRPAVRASVAVAPGSRQSIRRESAMTPLADRWDGRWGAAYGRPQPRVRALSTTPAQFGASARNPYRDPDEEQVDSDNDDRPVGTYRSVCVRLCDGYYFPISFAVTADHLERDRGMCESRCGAQGRLFVHRNPGGSTDDLQDLAGRPYRQLRTAFLYRTEYVPSCTCQPQPWEQASQDRHRVYALAASAKKGDKDAAKELQALQAKAKEDAKVAARSVPPSTANPGAGTRPDTVAAGSAKAAEIARREDGNFMGLGGNGAPKPKTEAKSEPTPLKSRSDTDWMKRAFDR